ncbi:MAG: SpaH/EbpB family LPXTG-anchored major pilin, partial [Eubacteriales bacterium]|nr:SpaH/EbpB family LPXTG-anchored major pilin [Eubacteriales bacterium]
KPGFDKQVLDNEKDDVTENAGQTVEENTRSDKGGYWGETADHAIGESFQFRLTATLPKSDTIDNYKSYYMAFHDTMSKELSFESIDKVVVTYTDANGQKQTKVITNYTDTTAALTETPDAEQKWSLEIMDLKAELNGGSLSEAQVDVIYNAHLNENAAISVDEKGNDDNQNNARLEYGNNPTWESNGKDKPDDTEETPDDTVFVFTYDVKNFKTKEDGTTPLAKAKFSVFTKDNDKTPINLIHVGEKDGYDTYRLAKAGETGVVTEIETSDSGKFRVIGLDAGAYVLKETFAPAGYVAAEDMDIEITTEHKENEDKETAELAKFTRTLNGEAFDENKIINEKGSKLPETGGMGTMLFYLLGGTMALGASGTLVFRKRISRK